MTSKERAENEVNRIKMASSNILRGFERDVLKLVKETAEQLDHAFQVEDHHASGYEK